MNHPARAQVGERLVDAKRYRFPALIGAAVLVVTLVDPGRKESAILAKITPSSTMAA
jgi:hypothetical protein